MIRILSIILAAILAASAALPAYSLPVINPDVVSSGATESRPLTSLPIQTQRQLPTQLTTADTSVDIFGYTVPKSAVRTDFGHISLGDELGYNGGSGRTLVFGSGNPSALASNDAHVVGLGSGSGSFLGIAHSQNPLPSSAGFAYARDVQLKFDATMQDILGNYTGPLDPGRFSGSSIIGADKVASNYGVTGKGVTVAIVDTGTDFSNEDMRHAVARDENGIPIMLDPDGQGLVLTKAKYVANMDERTGKIMNHDGFPDPELPANVTSYAYVNDTGVYLRTSEGTIPIFNSLYPLLGSPVLQGTANVDWKIGNSPDDYIQSKSGVYRMGVAYQVSFQFGVITVVLIPVLLVDSNEPGVYDTIIPDMSYAWYTFTLAIAGAYPQTNHLVPREPTFDFTDERPIVLGDGNEHLVYDYNGDGSADFSAGTAGARVLDIWRVTDNSTGIQLVDSSGYGGVSVAKLLEPIDPDGDYFGLMYDFTGHGTSTAATVASLGKQQYSIYGNSTTYALAGMAPDTKIIPVKSLWAGDAIFGWLYASGFDLDGGKWHYTGDHKADIINNSWGVSNFPLLKHGPGYDVLSMFSSLLVVPGMLDADYPGTMMINSAGNNGLGYGSVGAPNVSPFNIAVGATSNNVHLQYSAFNNITRFGSSAASFDEMAEFSSRGPGLFGDPKPELVAVGSYGFTPSTVTAKVFDAKRDDPNNNGAFALFGGTSMAAPMVAGAAALVISDLRERGETADPFRVKSILMSSAKDLNNDPFVQGAGRVDALAAVHLARGSAGKFLAFTESTPENILKVMAPAIESYDSTLGIIDSYSRQTGPLESGLAESRWFAGHIVQGQSASTDIIIENPARKEMKVEVSSAVEKLVAKYQIHNTTKLFQVDPTHNDKQYGFAPNYHNLEDLIGGDMPDADLMVAKVNFAFDDFLNSTGIFGDHLRIASLYSYDWQDADSDDKVAFGEITMISRGGSWGTVQELRVGDPTSKFKGTPLLGVYPVPTVFSFWSGDRLVNATSMDYTLTVEFYKRQPNAAIEIDGTPEGRTTTTLKVPAQGTAKVGATILTDDDTITGNYYGEILVSNTASKHKVVMPVSYVVTTKPVPKDLQMVIEPGEGGGGISGDVGAGAGSEIGGELGLRPNGYVGGLSDMTSRYSAGDWRAYYFNVQDPTITSANLKISWPHNSTSINAMAFGPDGKMVASSVPSGVFQEFSNWPSNDWLGTSVVSEGGFFYFSQNDGDRATVLSVPVSGTGTYSVLLHNTLFHGGSLYEPLVVEAKFSTLLPDNLPPVIKADLPRFSTGSLKVPVLLEDQNPAGLSYSIDGSAPVGVGTQSASQKAFVINANTSALGEGPHSIMIESADTVGHSSALRHQFIVDLTPPAADITLRLENGVEKKVEGTAVVSGNATILWDTTDPNGIKEPVLVTLPDARPARYPATSSVQFNSTALEDGKYEFVLRSEDVPGNQMRRNVQLIVDNTPPAAEVGVSGGGLKGTVPILLSVSDAHLATAMLKVGNSMVDVTGLEEYPLDTTFLPDGKHEVKLTAVDAAGNVSVAGTTLEVANSAPLIQAAAGLGVVGGVMAGMAVTWFALKRRR